MIGPIFSYICVNSKPMDNDKFRQYRALVYILGFIILFETVMLSLAIPAKTTFIWLSLGALAFLSLYLLLLCLRLVKELQEKSKK